MDPFTLQLAINNASKFLSLDKQNGRGEILNAFPPVCSPKLSNLRSFKFPSEFGMTPVRLFPNNCNSSKFTNWPISSGMAPCSPHRQIQSLRRAIIVQSCVGIEPTKPVFELKRNLNKSFVRVQLWADLT